MLAKLIEHWLDNAGERGGYEIPFCQALVAKGHTILFRSSHGPLEQGKDIITIDRKGGYHAYQLKAGDLTLGQWRDIRGEVEELVGLPIRRPGVPQDVPFTPHLVISGILRDPARNTVDAWMEQWKQKGFGALDLMDRDTVLRLFLDTHGDTPLVTPQDFERFLRLYLNDKRDILPKEDFAAFLESLVPLSGPDNIKRTELVRALAGAALLASYVLEQYRKAGNHFATAEGWMMVLAYLHAALERLPGYYKICARSIDLTIQAWSTSVDALTEEALASPRWIEGDFVTDPLVRTWRTTLLCGYLSMTALYYRAQGGRHGREDEIFLRVEKELRHGQLWGESLGPCYYAAAILLWLRGQEGLACSLCAQLVDTIAQLNAPTSTGLGLPDPYIEAHELLAFVTLDKDKFQPRETFREQSFLLRPLVEFLVRRGRKRHLRHLWYRICEVDSATFTLDSHVDFYRWHADTGSLDQRRWDHPQEWTALAAEANADTASPLLLVKHQMPLLLPFLLVYPHRLTASLARMVEASTTGP